MARAQAEPKLTFTLYGRPCTMQRHQLMFGKDYAFSGRTLRAQSEWDPLARRCVDWANARYPPTSGAGGGPAYNAALVNYYHNGSITSLLEATRSSDASYSLSPFGPRGAPSLHMTSPAARARNAHTARQSRPIAPCSWNTGAAPSWRGRGSRPSGLTASAGASARRARA